MFEDIRAGFDMSLLGPELWFLIVPTFSLRAPACHSVRSNDIQGYPPCCPKFDCLARCS